MNIKFVLITLIMTLFICNEGMAQSKSAKEKAKAKKEALAKARAKKLEEKKGKKDEDEEEKEDDTDEESLSLMKKLNPEIRLGNIQVSQGFAISLKPGVGYKINDYFVAGLGSRVFFNYYSFQGFEDTYLDFGGFVYGRAKIKSFYLQGEYASTKFEGSNNTSIVYNYPVVGGGYMNNRSEDGGWSYGFELMLPLSSEVRAASGLPVEYWINLSYNF
jgi:hypothetical protein